MRIIHASIAHLFIMHIYTCICKNKTKNVSMFSYFCKFTFITQFYATTKEKLKIK